MRQEMGGFMRMEQRQLLTPRMIQSMEILQMPLMALEERIDQELQANPVLEIKQPKPDVAEPAAPTISSDNKALTLDTDSAGGAEFDRLAKIADYLENEEYSGDRSSYRVRNDGERDGKMDAMANAAARGGSLTDHLLGQWRLLDIEPQLLRLGQHLIRAIEPDGYLRTPAAALIADAPFPITPEQFQAALRHIHQLDPSGVGARDLAECLLLQLDALEADEELAEGHDFDLERALVRDHLEDLKQNRYPLICKKLGYSLDEVKAGVRRLGRLSPHPGRLFSPTEVAPITPDATVYLDEDTGRYEINMRRDTGGELFIRKRYRMMMASKGLDKKTKEFLQDKVRSARWLMDAIEQRKGTIARVIRVVVDAQREFFERGPEFLKPLPMIQVADQLGIHVATVSRAVSEKWIQTPVGVYPLRKFFSMGTTSASGEEMSWDAVKEKIRKIIDEEDKQTPLNDDEIADKAKALGIELARRTVAKYRKLLNIPTARQRREFA